ncbi:hypothetical protein M3Y99_00771400 [Aphelenchoides fujianensis]|nr:hypothetical protein M3Y99_00771400 [Aphelenchoides fujianensis]
MFYHLLLGSTIGITVVSVCFAIPLYVFVLVAIVRNHRNAPFNSEFFTLFVALGIVDISCYLLFLFWTTQRTRQLIGGSVFVSFVLALPVPFSNCTITEYEAVLDGNVYTEWPQGRKRLMVGVQFYLKSVWTAHVCFVLVSSLFFYSWMIKRMRKTEFIQNKKKRNVEREMFFVGGTVVVLNALFRHLPSSAVNFTGW